MNLLKKQSESRLDTLKRDVVNIEAELEETRYAASVVGGQSIKEQQKTLMDKQFVARHSKERAEAAEQLQQRVLAGLVHLGNHSPVTTRTIQHVMLYMGNITPPPPLRYDSK